MPNSGGTRNSVCIRPAAKSRALFKYPDVFSKGGVISPSFWFSDQAYAAVTPGKLRKGTRIWMSIGDKEGDESVPDVLRMEKALRALSSTGQLPPLPSAIVADD